MSSKQNFQVMVPYQKQISADEFPASSYRFVVATLVVFGALISGITWLTFAPLIRQLRIIYDLSVSEANQGAINIQNIVMIPALLSFNCIMHKLNKRQGAILYVVLIAIGTGIRLFFRRGFEWIIIGQVFISLGSPYWASIPPKISCTWFLKKERTLATQYIMSAVGLSFAIGVYIPQWFVDLNAPVTEKTLDEIQLLLEVQAIATGGVALLIILLMKDEPEHPPSRAASHERPGITGGLKLLLKNGSFWLGMLGMGFASNAGSCIQVVYQSLFELYEISSDEASTYVSVGLFAGVIVGYPIAYICHLKERFKYALTGSSIIAGGFWLYMCIVADEEKSYNFAVGIIGMLTLTIAIQPTILEYLSELAFPVKEEFVASLFMISMLGVGNLTVVVADVFIEDGERSVALWFFLGNIGIGVLLTLIGKEDLKRHLHDKDEQDE